MAGMVFVSQDRYWGTSSSVFYWVVDALAERVTDRGVAQRLREVSEFNLGSFRLADFTPDERADLVTAILAIPQVARDTLPDSAGREAFIAQVQELADLVAGSSGEVDGR